MTARDADVPPVTDSSPPPPVVSTPPPPPPAPAAAPPPPPPASSGYANQPPPPGPGDSPQPPAEPPTLLASERSPTNIINTYDHGKSRWGLGDVFVSEALYLSVGFWLILLLLAATGNTELPSGPWLVAAVIGPQFTQLVHLTWVIRRKGTTFADDLQFRFMGPDIASGFALFVAGLVLAGITAAVITAIVGDPPVAAAVDLADELGDGGVSLSLVMFALLGATFIPVVEELVFRGLFWSALEKRGVRPWITLLITSGVFAGLHLEPVRTPVLFVLGLVLGYGRMRWGRLGPSIVMHVLINALALLSTVVAVANA